MAESWTPLRTLSETEEILCTPGGELELETRLVDGRLLRVYKHLAPSLREFWLHAVQNYAERTYIVFRNSRYTYQQIHQLANKAAILFRDLTITKGDRVAICSKNCLEFIIAFWACQLSGIIPVMINALLPKEVLRFCISHTEPKAVLMDAPSADLLEFLIAEFHPGTLFLFGDESVIQRAGLPNFMASLENMRGVRGATELIHSRPPILPEDDAVIMFTSGTTGLPKAVLSTQRQFLTNTFNCLFSSRRASLRRGDSIDNLPPTPDGGLQKSVLLAVPLFHVSGLTTLMMYATLNGMKIILMKEWAIKEVSRLIRSEGVTMAGGVPTHLFDLLKSSLVGYPLEGLMFGGAPAPDVLTRRAKSAFPNASLMQVYGLTETNSVAVGFAGEDYISRPRSTGLASPVNDVMIVRDGLAVGPEKEGEIWLRGPNIMKGYWKNPEATKEVLTNDGWLRTGDIGFLDKEGFLYVQDRLKDMIIRGGENISSAMVENALYSDPRIMEAAAVGVPDARLGELVAAVVTLKPEFRDQVSERSLLKDLSLRLPRFAMPVMILIQNTSLELTPSGKIVKGPLRGMAKRQWSLRKSSLELSKL